MYFFRNINNITEKSCAVIQDEVKIATFYYNYFNTLRIPTK